MGRKNFKNWLLLENRIKSAERERLRRNTRKMKVDGKSVKLLQRIIEEKAQKLEGGG